MKTLALAVALAALPLSAFAAPAIRLIVSNNSCIAEPCPGVPPPPTTIAAGTPFRIYVAALDGKNSTDPTFTGTVTFSSTDALATLPADFSFTPANEGSTRGGLITVLRTPGNQTITVRDVSGQLLPGSFVMTVTDPVSADVPVPTASGWAKLLLASTLAASGVWLARSSA